ncbi:aspartate--ammonia ligase [bacterium]
MKTHRFEKSSDRVSLKLPEKYTSSLNVRETEAAIKYIKDYYQNQLVHTLNLSRVSAPIIVLGRTGINDYLNGWEMPVHFHIRDMDEQGEVVQSLAKWKRMALADYGFQPGEGLYTDMNAIRPEETLDNLHSLYVDQWDWERIILDKERNLDFLKKIVRSIYQSILETESDICQRYPSVSAPYLPEEIYFIHSEELLDRYPNRSPEAREDAICKEKGAVFIIGIGGVLKNGQSHDGRASDYDDWTTETTSGRRGLNGDILVWYPLLNQAYELSSMGVRVDAASLKVQVEIKGESHKLELDYHRRLLKGELPLTIGGGIGQSRLCMLFLRKAHIGEVQASIWPDTMRIQCRKKNIFLL